MKNKKMKNTVSTLIIVFIVGVLINIIPFVCDVNRDVFYKWTISLSFCIIVIVLLVNLIIGLIHYSKVKKQIKLLNEGKAQEALEDMKKMLLALHKPRYIKAQNVCKINISAAYCDLGQYDKMQEVLDSVDTDYLTKKSRAVYELNVCACYYYMGDIKNANALYEENKNLFSEYKSNKYLSGNIEVIEIFYLLANKKYDEAREKFENLKKISTDSRIKKDFEHIENELSKQNLSE